MKSKLIIEFKVTTEQCSVKYQIYQDDTERFELIGNGVSCGTITAREKADLLNIYGKGE